jgi:uncharacterized membrane protein
VKSLREAFRTGNMPKGRLEAFSDGIIGVIITILVLEVRLPEGTSEGALPGALFLLLPKVASYVVSFAVVAVWWVAHHQLFQSIQRTDRGLLWLNSLFLLFLSFIPFPTALIGTYPRSQAAILVYALSSFLTGLCFVILRWYVSFRARLVSPEIPVPVLRSALRRGFLSPALYLLAAVSSFVSKEMSLLLFVIVPCIYFLPGLFDRHAPALVADTSP